MTDYEMHTIEERIFRAYRAGQFAEGCLTCDSAVKRWRDTRAEPFLESHTPSSRCQSGKRPHCTCDTCF